MTTIDELDVIRELRAAPDPSATARVAAADRLHTRMEGRGPRRPRWLLVAGAGAAAAIALFVVLAAGGEDSTLRPAPANAREVLNRTAAVALRRDDRGLRPGEYWYIAERSRYVSTAVIEDGSGKGYSAIVPGSRETWTGHDGRLRIVIRKSGKPEFFGARDRRRWEDAGRPPMGGGPVGEVIESEHQKYTFGSTQLSYSELLDLPQDGPAMYRRLIDGAGDAGNSPDEEAFVMIGDLLREAPVPPGVRAGLYRAAAYIKGIRLVGAVRDQLGRRGVAVELDSGDRRQRLVFDPETALLLAEQQLLTKRVGYLDAAPGTITGERIVVRQGIVSGDHARP
jgi:hypothetical protein